MKSSVIVLNYVLLDTVQIPRQMSQVVQVYILYYLTTNVNYFDDFNKNIRVHDLSFSRLAIVLQLLTRTLQIITSTNLIGEGLEKQRRKYSPKISRSYNISSETAYLSSVDFEALTFRSGGICTHGRDKNYGISLSVAEAWEISGLRRQLVFREHVGVSAVRHAVR